MDWFDVLATDCELSADADQQLRELGFVVMPGPVPPDGLEPLAEAYDVAVASAAPGDVSIGRSTTRVHDFVNRGPAFESLYVFPPLLEACRHVIREAFKLSTMHARTLRAYSPAQDLHVDFERDAAGFPMVGFILMLDDFRPDNGATRFIPGSHTWSTVPHDLLNDRVADYEGQFLACGSAGSIIIFNGSVWHGHTANSSGEPRRSMQGAYIRRDAQSWFDLPSRATPETLARISPIAHGHSRRTIFWDFVNDARDRVVAHGLVGKDEISDLMNDLKRHLDDPGTLVVSHLFFQVWGRRPNRSSAAAERQVVRRPRVQDVGAPVQGAPVKAPKKVEKLLEGYPQDVQAIALAVRQSLRQWLPGVQESADASAPVIGYSFGPGYRGLVCTLILSKSGVKLGLVRGSELADPHGLLAGSGRVHRHIQLRAAWDLRKAGVSQLVKAAHKAWKERQ